MYLIAAQIVGRKVYPDKDLLSTIKSIKMENGFKEAKIMEPAKISVYSIVGSCIASWQKTAKEFMKN